MRKTQIIGTLLIIALLALGACAPTPEPTPSPTPVPTLTPTPTPTPTPMPAKMTRDEAYLAVYTRLTKLAQSLEAKEYLTLFHMDSASWREYNDELGAWTVGISPGPEGYRLIKEAKWFSVADTSYFFDVHWDEPRPAWIVYNDGQITPIGKGLMVEADIEQLNSTRTLK